MKKISVILIVAISVVLGVGIGLSINPFKNSMKRETAKWFVPILLEMSQNENEKENYSSVISEIAPLVAEQAKKQPELFSQFIQDLIDASAKSNPGSAMRFENYANSQIRQEMDRLQKESSVEQLTEKEKQIAGLQIELKAVTEKLSSVLKSTSDHSANISPDSISELKASIVATQTSIKSEIENSRYFLLYILCLSFALLVVLFGFLESGIVKEFEKLKAKDKNPEEINPKMIKVGTEKLGISENAFNNLVNTGYKIESIIIRNWGIWLRGPAVEVPTLDGTGVFSFERKEDFKRWAEKQALKNNEETK